MDAFAYLLRDLKGRIDGFRYPERADATFAEARETVGGALTAIQKYEAEPLRKILSVLDDRLRLPEDVGHLSGRASVGV